jgi:hypothetical protein
MVTDWNPGFAFLNFFIFYFFIFLKNCLSLKALNVLTMVQKFFLTFSDQNRHKKVFIFAYLMSTGFGSVFANADPDPGEPDQCGSGSKTL